MLLILAYLLIPVALVLAFSEYDKTTTWIWVSAIIFSIFLGIAPYVALAYLFSTYKPFKESAKPQGQKAVTYHPDGSYTVYQVEDAQEGPSPARVAFKVIGGLVADMVILSGLFFIGIILLFTLAPSVACGGSSKCY